MALSSKNREEDGGDRREESRRHQGGGERLDIRNLPGFRVGITRRRRTRDPLEWISGSESIGIRILSVYIESVLEI